MVLQQPQWGQFASLENHQPKPIVKQMSKENFKDGLEGQVALSAWVP